MKDYIYFKQCECGDMQNYVYFVGDNVSKEVVLIDPSWELSKIQEIITKDNLILRAIILTHGHFDHLNVVPELQAIYQVPVYISVHEDMELIHKGMPINISLFKAEFTKVEDDFELTVGQVKIKFLYTPGHTPGGQCLLIDNALLITGDTLFLDGCGRWDLPGSDKNKLLDGIKTKIGCLNDDILVYPGHNYHSKKFDTIANQKKVNPVLNKL